MLRFPEDQFGGPNRGIRFTADTGIVRTEWESGNARQRRRYRHLPVVGDVSWQMSAASLHDFVGWLNTYAYDWFELRMESNAYSAYSIAAPVDEAMAWHQVRLIGSLAVANAGLFLYVVSGQVEVRPGVWPTP
jgi:hypothetical protein